MGFVLYTRRWFVVGAFAIVTFSNNVIWITWSPIATLVAPYWNVPVRDVDNLTSTYMYTYLPGSIFAMYLMVDVLGLSRCLWIGSAMNATGGIMRWLGMSSYFWVYVGTLFSATSQSFTVSAPPLIAAKWFGAHESATATAIGVLANQLGTAIGLGSTILINFNNPNNNGSLNVHVLERFLFVQAALSTLGCLSLVVFLRTDAPPTPPNAGEAARRQELEKTNSDNNNNNNNEETPLLLLLPGDDSEEATTTKENERVETHNPSFLQSVRLALKHGFGFACVYAFTVGTFYSIPPFISQFVPDWTRQESGWLGFLYQLTGVAGSLVVGRVVDRFQNHSFMSRLLLVMALVLFGGFWLFHHSSNQHWVVYGTMMGTGFSLAASSTLGYELGASISYPANEATVGALMQFLTQIVAFSAVTTGGWINASSNYIGILWGCVAVALAILLSIPTESNRPKEPAS